MIKDVHNDLENRTYMMCTKLREFSVCVCLVTAVQYCLDPIWPQ